MLYRVLTKDIAETMVQEIPDLDVRRAATKSLQMAPDIVQCVRTFHQVYGMPILRPSEAMADFSHMPVDRLAMRFRLIEEEYRELCEAMDVKVKFTYSYMDEDEEWQEAKDLEHAIVETENRDLPEIGDACVDLCYVIVGFCLEMGIDFHAMLEEVQASNLTKMGDDGLPVRREDGKILKGPNYVKADPEFALKRVGLRIGRPGFMSTAKPE